MFMVFTLGFHADHIIRRLFRAGGGVDGVLLATGRPVVRAVRQAYSEVAAICDRMGLDPPKLLDLPLDDPSTGIAAVLRELRGRSHIVADLGGGMRPVVIMVFSALLLAASRSFVEVYVSGEREDAPEIRIPLNTLLYALSGGLSREKMEILSHLARMGSATQHDLSQLLGRSERTIRAHLADLRRYELVKEVGGRIELTGWASLVMSAAESL